MKRTMALLALALSLTLCGFGAAAWLAARAGVAQGQGLAGGAIVIGYGVLGAAAGLLLVALLHRRIQGRMLNRLLVICALPAAVILVAVIALWLNSREEMQAHLEQAYANLPPFRIKIARTAVSGAAGKELFEADWGTRSYTVHSEGRLCEGSLSGKEAVTLLTALREAELILYRNANPCNGSQGEDLLHMTFLIPEALPPETHHDVTITTSCLQRYPALGKPNTATSAFITRCRQ